VMGLTQFGIDIDLFTAADVHAVICEITIKIGVPVAKTLEKLTVIRFLILSVVCIEYPTVILFSLPMLSHKRTRKAINT
jgi:hypothetical protein